MILASGAFDGLHAGHVAYLRAAAAVDEEHDLVVAVAPDSYIRTAKHREPRWPQGERCDVVEAIRCVDRVIAQTQPSVAETIRTLRPRYVVKGLDWVQQIPPDVAAACVEVGAALTFVDTEGTHGSAVTW